jgi:2-dehydropantoate 2-reductase
MEVVAEAIGPETILLTVQNGVDAPGEVAARFPRATVLAARQHGFFQVEDGVVRHVGVAPSILFGPVDKGDGNAATRMLSMFTQAAIPAALSADMLADLWAKLVLVSALGAWGAATGMSAGDLKHDSIAATQLEAAMDEVAGLARLKGVTLPADIVARTLGFVSKFPDDAKPSMQRDIEAGRSSEYESLTGAVIRMADELGLDVPVHRRLDTMIRARFFG